MKKNQKTRHAKVKSLPDEAVPRPIEGLSVGHFKEQTDDHDSAELVEVGRLETRQTWVVDDTQWLGKTLLKQWPGLEGGSLMLVERTRQDLGDPTGKVPSIGTTTSAACAGATTRRRKESPTMPAGILH